MDPDAARRLLDAFAGWSRDVGWRVDGWAALAALGLLWRPPGTILYVEGPSRPGGTQIEVAHQRLHLIAGIRVSRLRTHPDLSSRRTVVLVAADGRWAQRLVLQPSARPRPAVQTDPPNLLRIPPLDELLARRLHLLATRDADGRRRQAATVDACALATILPDRDRHRLAARLTPTTVASAAAVVARLDPDALSAVGGGHRDEVVDGLERLARLCCSP